jgi:hypothetical protein
LHGRSRSGVQDVEGVRIHSNTGPVQAEADVDFAAQQRAAGIGSPSLIQM